MNNKIGFEEVVINPKLNIALSGFSPLRYYHLHHSDLKMRVVVIYGLNKIVFITLDSIAVDAYLFKAIKDELKPFGFNEDSIIVSASHTHSGPAGLVKTNEGILKGLDGIFGEYSDAAVAKLLKTLKSSVETAISNLEEIKEFKFAEGLLSGVGKERHDPDLPGDERIVCWSYKTTSNRRVLFYNYACHPTILNGSSEYLSADFPGEVARLLSSEYDMVCFINGSAGDISTRFTRTSSDVDQINRFSGIIVSKLRELLSNSKGEELEKIKVKNQVYYLKTKDFGTEKEAIAKFNEAALAVEKAINLPSGEKRIIESYYEGAKTNLTFVKNFKGINEVEITVNFIFINGYRFVTIPAELFSSLSNPLRVEMQLNFLGYTNGYCMYIADVAAYEKGYYEALSSIYENGQGESLMDSIKKDYQSWLKALGVN